VAARRNAANERRARVALGALTQINSVHTSLVDTLERIQRRVEELRATVPADVVGSV
jgi:hypothetical protein